MNKVDSSIKIGSVTVKNRITYAPTVKFGWTDNSGIPIERHARHYEERAKGDTGLIVVEATCICPEGRLAPSQLGLWEDGQIKGHHAITEACHKHGTVVLVQLHHGGYNTHPQCGPSTGPSKVEWRDHQTNELTKEEIVHIRDMFINAAHRAKESGYDGIQLHACHAYLINQFISPSVNLRTDEYGGSTLNRSRFGCEIIRGIRETCGENFIISVRTPGAEPTLEEAWEVADHYIDAGADYLQVSSGIGLEEIPYPEGIQYNSIVWIGTQMFQHVKRRVPVSVVNGIREPELARYLIEAGLTDTIDSARALLADPKWSSAVISGTDYVKCRNCKVCFWSPFMPNKCPAVAKRHAVDPNCVDYSE